MQCFYHPESSARGLCRSCLRGLCVECAIQYDEGLACKNRCEQNVEVLIQLLSRSVRANKTPVGKLVGWACLVLGLIVIVTAYHNLTSIALGVFFVFMAALMFYQDFRLKK